MAGMTWRNRLKWRFRSLLNWLHGYKFGPVQRCRRCEHTTPYHYSWCTQAGQP